MQSAPDFIRCSVIGLGKLGSPLAAVLASKGFQTIGVDTNKIFVDKINSGLAPVYEPKLEDFIKQASNNLHATTDYKEAILESNVTFIIVPTPSNNNGFFSNKFILEAIEQIGVILASKSEYHMVNITSTVMPGSVGGEIKATLEKSSGKKIGPELGLCYNPEFIALGQIIKDMLSPDFILIGEADKKSGDILENIYNHICENKNSLIIKRMNFINAELTKISVNTYITTKITYANMLAEMCEHLPEADVDVVTAAMGMDSRIGSKYLKGRIGYAGPCFPRDNIAFTSLAKTLETRCDLSVATDKLNSHQVERLFDRIKKFAAIGDTIAVLGLSYKPDSVNTDASQGLALVNLLLNNNYKIQIYDPLINKNNNFTYKNLLNLLTLSIKQCLNNASVLVITTPHPEFANLLSEIPKILNKRLLIIDCWRQLNPEEIKKTSDISELIQIIHLGKHYD